MSNIEVNDLFEEMRNEINRLSNELLFANKCLLLFQNYRSYLSAFCQNCKCDQNIDNKLKLYDLEKEYKKTAENKRSLDEEMDNCGPIVDMNVEHMIYYDETPPKETYIEEENIEEDIDDETSDRVYSVKCNKCDQLFTSIQTLTVHKREEHSNANYVCDYNNCSMRFFDAESLSRHIESHEQIDSSVGYIKCNRCELAFSSKEVMNKHKKLMHSNVVYKCAINECKFESLDRQMWIEHVRRHTGEKPFNCLWPACNSKFVSKSELNGHVRCVHTNERPHKCSWPACDAAFHYPKNLRRHMLTHTGEKSYLCTYDTCSKRFASLQHLKIHLKTHNKQPMLCDWPDCGQVFARIDIFRRHMMKHNCDGKIHRCDWPQCGAAFKQSGTLVRHKLVHSREKNYNCEFCDRKFARKDSLKSHSKTHLKPEKLE